MILLCAVIIIEDKMTTTAAILNFASLHKAPFKRKELINALSSDIPNISEQTVSLLLGRLIKSGRISHVRFGYYAVPDHSLKEYVYLPTEYEQMINNRIMSAFPFIEYCVWSLTKLSEFMQHVPNVNTILVDVEREAMESVFHSLQSVLSDRQVLLYPSKKEIELYMNSNDIVIIRPLVKEAPLTKVQNCSVPKIEKILVDATGDAVFDYAGGAELYTIYNNVFSTYNVNRSRLLRYASRRGRKNEVEQILSAINHDK